MSNKLECLCYDHINKNGNKETVYQAYIGDYNAEQIEAKIAELVAEDKQNVRALTWAEYCAVELEDAQTRYNINKPQLINKEIFVEKFNILMPIKWNRSDFYEIFTLPESLVGKVYAFFIRLGRGESAQYFQVNAEISTSESDLFKLCEAAHA